MGAVEVWLDHITVVATGEPAPLSESRIAELLGPALARLPTQPAMVIDGRPASARIGATATYRLLAALGLDLAAPVAVSARDSATASRVMASLLRVCPGGGPALLVTTAIGTDRRSLTGCCLAARTPTTEEAVALSGPPLPARPIGGFMELLRPRLSMEERR